MLKLKDLIVSWLKKELPKAPIKETSNEIIFTIMRGQTPILKIIVHSKFLLLKSCFSSLEDEFIINDDNIVGGKWSKEVVLKAADPQFFGYLSYYIGWTASIITMGEIPPPRV